MSFYLFMCFLTVENLGSVVLWPPSASPMLYPMPIYGEASNHRYSIYCYKF
jgi:hypothetical protein